MLIEYTNDETNISYHYEYFDNERITEILVEQQNQEPFLVYPLMNELSGTTLNQLYEYGKNITRMNKLKNIFNYENIV